MPSTNLHVNARPFAHLLGTWRGAGKGFYPTINDFEYNETLRISAVPNKPFFRYEQRTTSPDGAPMHQELGYIRFLGGDEVEFVLAQPTGQAEALFGFISDATPSNCTLTFRTPPSSIPRLPSRSIAQAVFFVSKAIRCTQSFTWRQLANRWGNIFRAN